MTRNTSPSITIITSIPPACPSRLLDGTEVGKKYRSSCIDSWKRFGDKIVSVNNYCELKKIKDFDADIVIYPSESNGSAVAGRPLVLFDDLLQCAVQEKSDFIALTNSDIFLTDVENLKRQVSLLHSGEAIVSRRINVEHLRKGVGGTYKWGYDLFVLRREDIVSLCRENTLFFGEPWWDYYFLSNIILNGMTVKPTDSAHVLHIAHKEAYSPERWLATGEFSLKTLCDNIEAGKNASDPATRDFIDTVMRPSKLLPIQDAALLVTRNIKALLLYHVMYLTMFLNFLSTEDKKKKRSLFLFSCALTIHAEIKINFGTSSRERIKESCDELYERMSSIAA